MLKRLSARDRFELLIATFEPQARKAWLDAIEAIKSEVILRRIVERLERRDVEGAVAALGIDQEAFEGLAEATRAAFSAGGNAAIEGFPPLRDPNGHRIVLRFGMRNTPAEDWLREHSSTLITRVVEDQKQAARIIMTQRLAEGANPNTTALDIVGRQNRITGRREGGIIGLSAAQAEYVEAARRRLRSGDPTEMQKLFELKRRDRRFDRSLQKLINEGKTPDAAFINRWAGKYADSLAKLRAESISRTETAAAIGASKKAAAIQGAEKAGIPLSLVTKVWRPGPATIEARVQHQAMRGQEVQFDQPFIAPDGTRLDFPCDPKALPRHTVSCRCDYDIRFDYLARFRR